MCVSPAYFNAAELGDKSLDSTVLRSRREGYLLENDDDESLGTEDMDDIIPFYPEIVFHRVFSISVGKGVYIYTFLPIYPIFY